MGKRGRSSQKKERSKSNRRARHEDVNPEDMDDEIDTFHKQRDIIPLDVNEDFEESDEDNEQPVLDLEESSEDEDDDNDEDSDDGQLHGAAAKIAKAQKFLRAKFGGLEDEMHAEEDKEETKAVWGPKKSLYYEDSEVSSSEEEEEEAEVLRLQKERAKTLSMEDFGLEDVSQDDNDGEPEEILVKGKVISKSSTREAAEDDRATDYEEVIKDVNALSKEEQMDVVYSSAPELVGLLSELRDAVKQLESVNLLISKVKEHENTSKGGMRYLEVKQLLLLSYCQAITFYLLLKSEGQAVRDHPIIARLVEVKGLLDKMKELDENLPCELEEILSKYDTMEQEVKLVDDEKHDSLSNGNNPSEPPVDNKPSTAPAENKDAEVVIVDTNTEKKEEKKHKRQADQVGVQSMQMLKVRAALEQKLKNKGILNKTTSKSDGAQKRLKPVRSGRLETFDDFDDEVEASQQLGNGRTIKFQQLVTAKNKPKIISGDDDLPKRDDIGERRRKHELRVLAGAGIETDEADVDGEDGALGADDENTDMEEDSELGESEDEFYKQVKKQRSAKLAEKAEIYSRTSTEALLPELADGKRHISQQMEKNRGLTRARKKLNKNPRKKYRNKHEKAVVRRKGQVQEIRKPTGPYGGEATGINKGVSRSIRFKS